MGGASAAGAGSAAGGCAGGSAGGSAGGCAGGLAGTGGVNTTLPTSDWPASGSATKSLPCTMVGPSSDTAPVVAPVMVAASLVPLIVTVTTSDAVPSSDATAKLSVRLWPSPSDWIAACPFAAA